MKTVFSRRKVTAEEVERKREELEKLRKEYEELQKKVEEAKRKLSAVKGWVGGKITVNIVTADGSVVQKQGRITPHGILVKYAKRKHLIVWDPAHIIFKKKGLFGKVRAEIYVDLDRGVSLPPPSTSGVKGIKEISSGAVQGALMLYRALMTRSAERRLMIMMLVMFAITTVALLLGFWIYSNNVANALRGLQETLDKLNEFIQNMPQLPQPVPGAGG